MATVSGVVSRQLLPACGNLFFLCPGLRPRSRQPLKRYKHLIAAIFPKNQEDGPNDRAIGKLCEYASKNPLRIPKITTCLEQRCYKELRIENFASAKIVMCIYRKLLTSCKEQLPLFASSLLTIITTLLEQSQEDLQVMGCETLYDFVNCQKDGTFMFNLEGFIPILCEFAQELGEDERAKRLQTAGLQALSSMVWFMGEHSHIAAEFDNVVTVVLENYGSSKKKDGPEKEGDQKHWVQEVMKDEGHAVDLPSVPTDVPSWSIIINASGEVNVTAQEAKNPCFWSRVCLHNMSKLAQEATTFRRVLESLFRYFDSGNLWSLDQGLAFPVLKDIQLFIDSSGQTHVMLSTLIKHLDHKNILKEPNLQIDVIEVTTALSEHAKTEASVAIIGAVAELMRHLRKCIHSSLDEANLGAEVKEWNTRVRETVDKCLVELVHKLGDSGQVLDLMSVMLENMSSNNVIARTTISAVYCTAKIIAPIPNLSYKNKTFPEALFHHLVPLMVHPDHETRMQAHRIFSVVLVPSSISPCQNTTSTAAMKGSEILRTLSRTVSVFSSSAALFEKLKKEKPTTTNENSSHDGEQSPGLLERLTSYSRTASKRSTPALATIDEDSMSTTTNQNSSHDGEQSPGLLGRLTSYSRTASKRSSPALATIDEDSMSSTNMEVEAGSLKLTSRQMSILLSSIWCQCLSPENIPENYEAIAHTYSLVLLFSRGKNSSYDVLTQSFQLAFSLKEIAVRDGGKLPPSCRRSLFTLATAMILFSSKAYNILPLVYCTKVVLTEKWVDPYLQLVDDLKLQRVDTESRSVFGSQEDSSAASKSLSQISLSWDLSREFHITEIVKNLGDLPESKLSSIKDQLGAEFLPDEMFHLGGQLVTDRTHQTEEFHPKDDSHTEGFSNMAMEDAFIDSLEAQGKLNEDMLLQNPDLLSADQLLESVLETANQVGRTSVSAPGVTFNEITLHCEELQMGKQKKMSHLMSVNQMRQDSMINSSLLNNGEETSKVGDQSLSTNPFRPPMTPLPMHCGAVVHQQSNSFHLPALSPYDNFLKAAGG